VPTLSVIRRWVLRDQMSIREIARRTGLARNTVKKYLRLDETEPSDERRVCASKRYPYAGKLSTWLGIEATKSWKQRSTLRPIHTVISLKLEMTAIDSKIALQKLNPKGEVPFTLARES